MRLGGFGGGNMKPEFSQGGMGRAIGGGMGGGGFGGFRQMPGGAFQRQGGMNPMVQALRGGGGMGGFGGGMGGFSGGLESLNSLNAGGAQSSAFPRQSAPYGGGGGFPRQPAPYGGGGFGKVPQVQQQNPGMSGGMGVPKRPMPMGPMTPGNGVSFAGVSGGGPGADVARMNARMGGRMF
jgi:hypothetical protein